MAKDDKVKDEASVSMEVPKTLGYLGLLPFFVGAVAPWVFPQALDWFTRALQWYSLAMLSFLSGSIWGMALQKDVPARSIHLTVTHIFLVLGWIAMFLPTAWGLGVLIVCYIGLFQWERYTHLKYTLTADYLQLRQLLIWPAIACHMLAIFNVVRAAQ